MKINEINTTLKPINGDCILMIHGIVPDEQSRELFLKSLDSWRAVYAKTVFNVTVVGNLESHNLSFATARNVCLAPLLQFATRQSCRIALLRVDLDEQWFDADIRKVVTFINQVKGHVIGRLEIDDIIGDFASVKIKRSESSRLLVGDPSDFAGTRYSGAVHESLVTTNRTKVMKLELNVRHYGYVNQTVRAQKTIRYGAIAFAHAKAISKSFRSDGSATSLDDYLKNKRYYGLLHYALVGALLHIWWHSDKIDAAAIGKMDLQQMLEYVYEDQLVAAEEGPYVMGHITHMGEDASIIWNVATRCKSALVQDISSEFKVRLNEEMRQLVLAVNGLIGKHNE